MECNKPSRTLEDVAKGTRRYPVEAFHFVREGLQFTVERLHGQGCEEPRHVSGQDLCWGLRDYAFKCWGLMAPAVLRSWNVTRTEDFGKMVFAMVEAGWMARSDHDSINDFEDVYDFRAAFEMPIASE